MHVFLSCISYIHGSRTHQPNMSNSVLLAKKHKCIFCHQFEVHLLELNLLQDDLVPAEKKAHFLQSGGAELQRALDFQICSKSDVFVPAIAGLFYGNVAGKRIASGRTQILVPSQVPSSSPIASSNFISTYVSKKNHLAYSCFC